MHAAKTLCCLLLAAPLLVRAPGSNDAAPDETPPPTAPYRVLMNEEGPLVNLLFTPFRPLVAVGDRLWAVNSHDSRLVGFGPIDEGGSVARELALPWGPVSLASWEDAGERTHLLVVCRGTHGLADVGDGSALERWLQLPSEPSDVVVRASDDRAFVSCAAVDLVVEVDLVAFEVVREIPIASKHPVFLSLAGDDVLVAPMFSGNNSTVDPGAQVLDTGPGRVLDLADPAVAEKGLPDEDLYAIRKGADAAEPVLTAAGTVLFAQGVHPGTGELWLLHTDARNKGAGHHGEKAVRGRMVTNRIAIARLPDAGAGPVAPDRFVGLDTLSEADWSADRTPVAQPCALAFDARGHAFVAGLGTDVVAELDASGALLREWSVGSLPRGLLADVPLEGGGGGLAVLCWGSNEVQVWDVAGEGEPALRATLDLGRDPMPADVQAGRELWYDASNSLLGNASCNSCHVDGLSDLLGWDLSNLPVDDKGPLMTQSLRNLNGKQPFHWRGERARLVDFNPAFDALMGGRPLDLAPGGEFEQLRAFLFSLAEPANPLADRRRLVSDASARIPAIPANRHGESSAVRGQRLYFEHVTSVGKSCHQCHSLPSGTSNDMHNDEPGVPPRRSHFKGASTLGLWRKNQKGGALYPLKDGRTLALPPLGNAFASTGLAFNLADFISTPLHRVTEQDEVDLISFLLQIDTGLAPAVHQGFLLDADTRERVLPELEDYLLPQARARNCDVVALGADDDGETVRWLYDPRTDRFQARDDALEPRSLEGLAGPGRTFFLGLPVGMGRAFWLDRDDEAPVTSTPDEVAPVLSRVRNVYATVRAARVQFDTDEPATCSVELVDEAGERRTATCGRVGRSHTVHFLDLEPRTTYAGTVRAVDAAGNESAAPLPLPVQTQPLLGPRDVVVEAIDRAVDTPADGTLRVTADFRIRFKDGRRARQHEVVVNAYVNDETVQTGVVSPPTDEDGRATLVVEQPGLEPGDVLTVGVEFVRRVDGPQNHWSLADTAPELRDFSVVYPER